MDLPKFSRSGGLESGQASVGVCFASESPHSMLGKLIHPVHRRKGMLPFSRCQILGPLRRPLE